MTDLLRRSLVLAAVGAAALAAVGAAAEPHAETEWLRAEIERFVRARAPEPPDAVEVPALGDFATPGVAAGELEVALSTRPRERFAGRVPVTVALARDGRELRRGVVTVRVRTEREVVVAARRLARGARIVPGDLRVERRDLGRLPEGWLADPAQAVGLRLRRGLVPGSPLAEPLLESAPAVARGATVRLLLRHGALQIEGTGQTRGEGREGDSVRVVNRDSGRELVGRVGADGAVYVDF